MANEDETPWWHDLITGNPGRRRFLVAAGSGTAMMLAGCSENQDGEDGQDGGDSPDDGQSRDGDSGDGDSGQDDSGDGSGTRIYEHAFYMPQGFDLSAQQWNKFNPGNFGPDNTQFWAKLAGQDRETGEWQPHLLKSWERDGSTVEVTVDERFTWHNGEQVTAEDLITGWRLKNHLSAGSGVGGAGGAAGFWDFADSVELVDEMTARINLSGEVNENVLFASFMDTYLFTPRFVFGEYLDRLEEADENDDDDAFNQAKQDLVNFAWREPVGAGPFKVESRSSQEIRGTIYEDYPYSIENDGKLNYDTFVWKRVSSDQQPQEWINDNLDGREVINLPKDLVSQAPDKLDLSFPPVFDGVGLEFNYDEEPYDRRRVRQALNFALDKERVVSNALPDWPERRQWSPITTGMVGNQAGEPAEQWLGSDADKLIDYSKDIDRAAELLRQDGFTKENGNWMTPDGNRWEISVKGLTGAEDRYRTVSEEWTNFGIKTEATLSGFSSHFGKTLQKSNFTIAQDFFGGGQRYPYFGFQNVIGTSRRENVNNFPADIETPMPVGDPEGSTKMINLPEKIQALATTADEAEQKQLITELAWIFNVNVPMITLDERILLSAMMSKPEYELPPKDSMHWRIDFPVRWLHQAGQIKYLGDE